MQPSGRIQWSQLCLPMRFRRMLIALPSSLRYEFHSSCAGPCSHPPLSSSLPSRALPRPAADISLCWQTSRGITPSFGIHDGSLLALAIWESQCGLSGFQVSQPKASYSLYPEAWCSGSEPLSQAWPGRPLKGMLALLTQQRHGHSDDESHKTRRAT